MSLNIYWTGEYSIADLEEQSFQETNYQSPYLKAWPDGGNLVLLEHHRGRIVELVHGVAVWNLWLKVVVIGSVITNDIHKISRCRSWETVSSEASRGVGHRLVRSLLCSRSVQPCVRALEARYGWDWGWGFRAQLSVMSPPDISLQSTDASTSSILIKRKSKSH